MNNLVTHIRGFAFFSTLLAAVILSACWTTFWLLVFFGSTWVLGFKTGAPAFILAFWLGVASESIIRWAENTNMIVYLSKPKEEYPTADNTDYSLAKATILLFFQLAIITVFLFLSFKMPDQFSFNIADFAGQDENDTIAFTSMVSNWWQGLSHPAISVSLFMGFIFRVLIYKRKHS